MVLRGFNVTTETGDASQKLLPSKPGGQAAVSLTQLFFGSSPGHLSIGCPNLCSRSSDYSTSVEVVLRQELGPAKRDDPLNAEMAPTDRTEKGPSLGAMLLKEVQK
jgi:hypothetical protein